MVRLSVKALCLSAVALASAKSPLLAWTNKNVADVSSTNYADADDVATLLAPFLDSCPESVLILDQPSFNIADLNEMRAVKSAFESAKSALQIGHFDTDNVNNIDTIVNTIAEKCSNAIVSEEKIGEENSIVIKKLSGVVSESQRIIKNLLKKVNDNTLVVYLSNNNVVNQKLLVQRQEPNVQLIGKDAAAQPTTTDAAAQPTATDAAAQPNQTTQADGQTAQGNAQGNAPATTETATFGKYVFFNTAVFEGLVALTPVVLISLIGISWLISIQTPTRFSNKKKD